MPYTPQNDPELFRLVDAHFDARVRVLLNVHRLQSSEVEELDAQARAHELRDFWAATPGCVYHDGAERGEEPEDYWSVDLLIAETDSRAREAVKRLAENQGKTLPENHDDD